MRLPVIRIIVILALTGLVLGALLSGWGWWRYHHDLVVTENSTLELELPQGTRAGALTVLLEQAGIRRWPREMQATWRLRGDSHQLKAGNYELRGPLTVASLLDILVQGQPDRQALFTLVEGQTLRQLRAALARAPGLVPASRDLPDAELATRLGLEGEQPEGWFAPDTYSYAVGSTDLHLLGRAHRLQTRRLDAAWNGRDPDLRVTTPYDLLKLASIIEKETGQPAERDRISAVFNNRLKKNMMLQTDPTVIYGLGAQFDGNLRKRDLTTDGPYNSYTRRGLPPTPIAMPGAAALHAAAHPADVQALYFVARGDGTSQFSDDLPSHNRAVRQYQLTRRADAGS